LARKLTRESAEQLNSVVPALLHDAGFGSEITPLEFTDEDGINVVSPATMATLVQAVGYDAVWETLTSNPNPWIWTRPCNAYIFALRSSLEGDIGDRQVRSDIRARSLRLRNNEVDKVCIAVEARRQRPFIPLALSQLYLEAVGQPLPSSASARVLPLGWLRPADTTGEFTAFDKTKELRRRAAKRIGDIHLRRVEFGRVSV
jgi:hypothetical protein